MAAKKTNRELTNKSAKKRQEPEARRPRPLVPLSLIPEARRARVGQLRVRRRVQQLLDALLDADRYGAPERRELMQASMNVVHALAIADSCEDIELVRKMQTHAVDIIETRMPAVDGEGFTEDGFEAATPLATRAYGTKWSQTECKLELLQIVSIAAKNLIAVSETELADGARLELRSALAKARQRPISARLVEPAPAEESSQLALAADLTPERRALKLARAVAFKLNARPERFAPILGRTPTLDAVARDVVSLAAVFDYLIGKRAATLANLVRAIATVFDTPTRTTKNFVTDDLIDQHAQRLASGKR